MTKFDPSEIDRGRRNLLAAAAASAATLPLAGAARAKTASAGASFGPVKQVRWRLGLAQGEPKYDQFEQRLAASPPISVPTITMEGDVNGAPHSPPSAYASKFTASTPTGPSPAASATTSRRRRRRPSHRR